MHLEFASGRGEAVCHDRFEKCQPVGSFPARRKTPCPKVVESEHVPELKTEPQFAPVAHIPDAKAVHPDANDVLVVRFGRTLFGEQFQLIDAPVVVDSFYSSLPFAILGIIEFTEIERSPLEDAFADANVFHHAPVVMDLSVFLSLRCPQKHAGIVSYPAKE